MYWEDLNQKEPQGRPSHLPRGQTLASSFSASHSADPRQSLTNSGQIYKGHNFPFLFLDLCFLTHTEMSLHGR